MYTILWEFRVPLKRRAEFEQAYAADGSALHLVFALIFVGGLARLTMLRPDVIFGSDLIVSLVAELVLMPILYLWLPRIVKSLAPDPSPAMAD